MFSLCDHLLILGKGLALCNRWYSYIPGGILDFLGTSRVPVYTTHIKHKYFLTIITWMKTPVFTP